MENAYRYTDQHVREDEDLYRSISHEYLNNYEGEFDLLLSYKRRLDLGEDLTVPMIRATLNCMRFDARVKNLPEPRHNVVDVNFQTKVWVKNTPESATHFHRDPEGVEEFIRREYKERPLYIELPTRWNKTYGMSTWVSAHRIHRVNPNSHIEYNTGTREFTCKLWWLCKTPWGMGKVPVELMNSIETAAILFSWKYWDLCKTCQRLNEEGEVWTT